MARNSFAGSALLAGSGVLAVLAAALAAARGGSAGLFVGALTAVLAGCAFLLHRQAERGRAFQRILLRNEQFLREVESVSRVGGWRFNEDQIFTELSEQACAILCLPAGSNSVSLSEFCTSFDMPSAAVIKQIFLRALEQREPFDTEIQLRRGGGEAVWLHLKGEVQGGRDDFELVGAIQDITQAKDADRLIEYQANYDSLTGLPNRQLFCDRLESALRRARRNSTKLAVCFIDLDNFKSVNDNLGHDAGDQLLVEVSRRIRARLRESDTVARYSGDEFIVVISDVFSSSSVLAVAAALVHEIGRPFTLGKSQVYCGASIGIAFFPNDGDDVETLITKADQAMYGVKKSGRNGWQFYTEQMQIESEQRHRLYNELVDALNRDQLQVYYQPIVDARTRAIVSCEALVRWRKPNGEWVAPDAFIPVAEERGIVNRIDWFVLREATRRMTTLNAEAGTDIGLSINVSPRLLHLRDDVARSWLEDVKEVHGLRLTVEITEHVLVESTRRERKVLEELSEAGVRLAIDDFGTGYSGLSYFSRFPVGTLKIDRSFISKIEGSSREAALVEGILLLTGKLGVDTVAEGVETEAQARLLARNGCSFLQGYLIARPMPAAELLEFVRGWPAGARIEVQDSGRRGLMNS